MTIFILIVLLTDLKCKFITNIKTIRIKRIVFSNYFTIDSFDNFSIVGISAGAHSKAASSFGYNHLIATCSVRTGLPSTSLQ